MPHYRLALLGFGNVGQALARLLLQKETELQQKYQIIFSVTGIATGRHGRAIDPAGLDLDRALSIAEAAGSLDELSTVAPAFDTLAWIRQCPAEVLFENTSVDYQAGQPAIDHLRTSLETGKHVITANKGPVAHAYQELRDLAKAHDRAFLFESTVMDGAPVFSMFRSGLPAANLRAFTGVLNSTTNLILSRMEAGETFDQAVAYAQSVGIAETDPSGDVDGWDAAIKVAALVTVLMGVPLKPAEVARQGIRVITPEAIAQARDQDKRWKLVCMARREGQGVVAQVGPQLVASDSPLYHAEGTTSIIQFETDVLGKLSLMETDPSPATTAYGLLADFLNAVRGG